MMYDLVEKGEKVFTFTVPFVVVKFPLFLSNFPNHHHAHPGNEKEEMQFYAM